MSTIQRASLVALFLAGLRLRPQIVGVAATLASVLAVPIALVAGWRGTLAAYSAVSVLALVPWLGRRHSNPRPPEHAALPWRSAHAWLIAAIYRTGRADRFCSRERRMLGIGYAIAAVAPFALGALRDATGGFTAPLTALAVNGVALFLLSTWLDRVPRSTRDCCTTRLKSVSGGRIK